MIFRWLADLTVLLHLAFILFAVLGALLVLRWRWSLLLHLPALVWAVLIELMGWICPLTPLENHLRRLGGEAGYGGGFIEHYVLPQIYPETLTRGMQLLLGLALLAWNVMVYALIVRRWQRRWQRRRSRLGPGGQPRGRWSGES